MYAFTTEERYGSASMSYERHSARPSGLFTIEHLGITDVEMDVTAPTGLYLPDALEIQAIDACRLDGQLCLAKDYSETTPVGDLEDLVVQAVSAWHRLIGSRSLRQIVVNLHDRVRLEEEQSETGLILVSRDSTAITAFAGYVATTDEIEAIHQISRALEGINPVEAPKGTGVYL